MSIAHCFVVKKIGRIEMDKNSGNSPLRIAQSNSTAIHPAWVALIRHCQEMGFGEIERLKIQDGIPVMAEKSIQRIKLG